ncbi:envelope stress sensor histidine kinase CpxA [Candidatus Profftia sp. (ex Adelges kitamiensis)]|uniref:envelope stress sensor histidine kinase CpxA n=1 Tax=Candidatus Profftia sp. (ex Adelges kitamiensis) TaxID=2864218 RepID=UPI001CE34A8E|nr:envelope stress sensor histidine kinase CpxA [Candidatus Profftia sp. (ex Adelges kitamiensis)]
MNNLKVRIFTIFWLMLILVLMVILLLLKLDENQLNDLIDSQIKQEVIIEKKIKNRLTIDITNDLVWWKILLHNIDQWLFSNPAIILVTKEGYIIKNQRILIQNMRTFINTSDNRDILKKNKYSPLEKLGPLFPKNNQDQYQFYLVRQDNNSQDTFINLIFNRPIFLLLITIFSSTPLLIFITYNLVRRALKPKNTIDNIKIDSLNQQPELEFRLQEFLATDNSLNQIVITLQKIVNTQQILISNISHELRSPLTRLQLTIALMRRRYKEYNELSRIEMEIDRIDNMINDLILLSHNVYQTTLEKKYLKANELWYKVLKNAKFEASEVGKILEIINPLGPWPILGNYNALNSALENSIRNAIYYSYNKIIITFNCDSRGIIIKIDDDGFGVTQEEHEQIFHPFYRTNEARNSHINGTGLGLAIVRMVVEQHHGWVKVKNSILLGGLCLKIWLPLYIK